MLFNSYEFLFLFLPGTLLVYFGLRKALFKRLSLAALIFASFLFYAWWNPIYLPLLLFSICINYSVAYLLLGPLRKNRPLLVAGLIFNIGLLAYFKYTNFLLGSFDTAFGTGINPAPIILPLAISFFTFQKIAFIVDAYRGDLEDLDPLHYMLFVSFFPQLIAGPIVHHREIMPQFARGSGIPVNWSSFASGISIFTIGLFKKTVIADHLAPVANEIFAMADQGQAIVLLDAWAPSHLGAIEPLVELARELRCAVDLSQLRGLAVDEALAALLKRAREARVLPADIELSDVRRLFAVITANARAVQQYAPRPCTIPNVTLVRAADAQDDGADRARGWGELLGASLDVRVTQGNHLTMLAPPYVKDTAVELARALPSW